MQKIGFDLISDLYLNPGDNFDWSGNATSLYCVVAGNISHDLKTLERVLKNLARLYQGVFVTLGTLEYQGLEDMVDERTDELIDCIEKIRNVALLHHHVVIVDGVAILGANGWCKKTPSNNIVIEANTQVHMIEDISYLKNSIEKLQKHLDVRKILMVTNSVPNLKLYFGEAPEHTVDYMPLSTVLEADTEKKITHWAFGTYEKTVDTNLEGINYFNNPKYSKSPYWAKRITIEV